MNENQLANYFPNLVSDKVFEFNRISSRDISHILKEVLDMKLLEQANEIGFIEDSNTANRALTIALKARKALKMIDDFRKDLIADHLEYVQEINGQANHIKDCLSLIENAIHGKIDKWIKLENENIFTQVQSLNVDDGSLTVKEKWEVSITDEALVPREFLTINMNGLKKVVDNGVRTIPGVEIKLVKETQLRVKN